ncbi:hypothetical protein E2I00_004028 [Balaenoptera physalus]|uniref:G-protein coupled receptors family 1 profile domain-containing protein n=1 Tax=Balaenoptera physalus TaxID=9770 RepID=A0A643C8F0_BALPH|nr:hypothetical protein E2I00_004028 [Balaenoptera physalus]
MLAALLEHGRVISKARCAAHFFLFTFLAPIDCCLLAIMAYDRYVAVAFIRTVTAFTLFFCGNNEIDFLFCDLPPLLKLAGGESYTEEVVIIVFAIIVMPDCISVILVSYLFVIVAIMQVCSAWGQAKTFSTCASHLTAVTLFFRTLIFMYLRDNSGQSSEADQVVSVLYTVVTPMLNPLIYSLRNKEVKESVVKSLSRSKASGRP